MGIYSIPPYFCNRAASPFPLLLLTPTGAESEDAFYAPTFLITGSSLNATFTTSRVSRIGKGLYFGYDDMERKRIWR